MKVLAINGSPHKNGVTALAIKLVTDELLAEGISTELIHIGNTPIRGCTDCLMCRKTGSHLCVENNDMVNKAIALLDECDGIIIGAPTYFCGIPGPAKAFFDRFFYASQMVRPLHFKVGTAVTALRRSGGVTALHSLYCYMMPSHIIAVPSQFHNALFGKSKKEALKDKEGVQTLQMVGKNMAWLMHSLEYSKNAYPHPEFIERIRTNFPGEDYPN